MPVTIRQACEGLETGELPSTRWCRLVAGHRLRTEAATSPSKR